MDDLEQIKKYINSIGLVFIAIPVLCLFIAISKFNPVNPAITCFNAYKTNFTAKKARESAEINYNTAKASAEAKAMRPKHLEKFVYEVNGMQLGSGASFAEPFENMIDVAKDSKLRIKSINYNYKPESDPLLVSGLSGYNVCEMDIISVGTYVQIKNFLSGMLSKPYLVRLADLKIEPWGYDKSILIASFKLTLYTKS